MTRDEQSDPHENTGQSLGGLGLQKDTVTNVTDQWIDSQCRSCPRRMHDNGRLRVDRTAIDQIPRRMFRTAHDAAFLVLHFFATVKQPERQYSTDPESV